MIFRLSGDIRMPLLQENRPESSLLLEEGGIPRESRADVGRQTNDSGRRLEFIPLYRDGTRASGLASYGERSPSGARWDPSCLGRHYGWGTKCRPPLPRAAVKGGLGMGWVLAAGAAGRITTSGIRQGGAVACGGCGEPAAQRIVRQARRDRGQRVRRPPSPPESQSVN
jgi:hypothetical protein